LYGVKVMKMNEKMTAAAPVDGGIKRPAASDLRVAGASRAWLIVTTNVGKEGLVVPQLLKADYEVYRPMCHKIVTHNWQRVIKAAPLFPNHLFVRKLGEGYERITGMLGVSWVFPFALLDSVIERMKSRETKGFVEIVATLDPERGRVKIGEQVKTLDGMLDVVVSEHIDNNRVAALSYFMNGNSKLVVDLHKVIRKPGA
jgi:hypothetical protein